MKIDPIIKRPALRYYGSQWSSASWIIQYWPKHSTRVLPFMGGLGEELRAPMAAVTNCADLDGRVINFFSVLRNQPENLIYAIRLTPWHETEFELAKIQADDPLEDARRFWHVCWMAVSGGPDPGKSGFRWVKKRENRYTTPASDGLNVDYLRLIAGRLLHYSFLQMDGIKLIEKHQKLTDCLIWCDPPFVAETRKHNGIYNHETDNELHVKLAKALHQVAGFALVTGYGTNKDGSQNDLYVDLYESADWHRVDRECRTNSGSTRIQSIWMSPKTWSALIAENPLLHFEKAGEK